MKKGFTLIEVLLVISIIGIIASIAVPAILAQQHRNEIHQKNPMLTWSSTELVEKWGIPDQFQSGPEGEMCFYYYKNKNATVATRYGRVIRVEYK